MPISSSNLLFHQKTLLDAIKSFPFPQNFEVLRQKIQPWLSTLESGTLDEVKETSLHGDFLRDVFQDILGYRSVIQGGGQSWQIHAEQTIADGGGSADGALGFFTATEGNKGKVKLQGRVVAPIELKGAKSDLDRPDPGRKESAVDQGWRYANYTADCRWVIVSNYRELRLYQTSKTPAYYEAFRLRDLADLEAFKKFYFLLCCQNFLPVSAQADALSRIDVLLKTSNEAEKEVTDELYAEYKQVRLDLTHHFQAVGAADLPNREVVLIEKAQKVLDRVLFVAFCEDRQLLPEKTIAKAFDHKDPYNPRPIWDNFKSVFRWVDQGNENPPIPGYNGGLFKYDPLLDGELAVPDKLCAQLKQLTRFDFDTDVSVDILGHIFEQSVTDLEELRSLARGETYNAKKGKRKTQGVYYTPAFITQYIVGVALGGYLARREQALRDRLGLDQISKNATKKLQQAEITFWEAYRDEVLLKTRVMDPACGSGAFLIAAFDFLLWQYERVNEALAGLKAGQRSIFDLNKTILNNNLYGVDLSSESVEITKLSLWLKTAERGKPLTYLDDNIKVGNSIVADVSLDSRAFDWDEAFGSVFADGGFDVVIGNPPYVRQELLSAFKPYLQQHYESYDGVADLYTYFYEKGLKILKPDGVLSYIVTNKWLKAGYGEPLRRFFAQNSVLEQIIDFGHAPIFEDAETFPCIVSVRKPITLEPEKPEPKSPVLICPVPRDKLADINLTQYVQQEGYEVSWSRFTADSWSLESPEVDKLIRKISDVGIPLKNFAGAKPYRGALTGFNEAFLIDEETKNRLIQEDPKSSEVIKPYLRGQDVRRWNSDWKNIWMIFARRGINIHDYSAVEAHLKQYREKLEPRPKDWDKDENGDWSGQKSGSYQWYELQDAVDYFPMFEQPKIIWKDLSTYSEFSFDESGIYTNDLCFILPSNNRWLLAVLNSPLLWYFLFRVTLHGANETLRLKNIYTEAIPIAAPIDTVQIEVEFSVNRLIEITKSNHSSHREVLDWLRVEHGLDKPGEKLEKFASLDCDQFVQEVKKRKPKAAASLSPKALKELREAYNDYAPAIQTRNTEALKLEHRLSDLVNQAYGLTPEEIDLMWKTAPPRMPINRSILP